MISIINKKVSMKTCISLQFMTNVCPYKAYQAIRESYMLTSAQVTTTVSSKR